VTSFVRQLEYVTFNGRSRKDSPGGSGASDEGFLGANVSRLDGQRRCYSGGWGFGEQNDVNSRDENRRHFSAPSRTRIVIYDDTVVCRIIVRETKRKPSVRIVIGGIHKHAYSHFVT